MNTTGDRKTVAKPPVFDVKGTAMTDSAISTHPGTVDSAVDPATTPKRSTGGSRALAVARIVLGWIFLWTFLDKTFGLYGTPADRAWVTGASPTQGYLSNVDGTFSSWFAVLSGSPVTDVLFMGGMAGLGVALVLGIGLRTAAIGAVALLGSLWLSALPLETNPVIDQHLVYLAAIVAFAAANAGDTWGLGRAWARTRLVRRIPILR